MPGPLNGVCLASARADLEEYRGRLLPRGKGPLHLAIAEGEAPRGLPAVEVTFDTPAGVVIARVPLTGLVTVLDALKAPYAAALARHAEDIARERAEAREAAERAALPGRKKFDAPP